MRPTTSQGFYLHQLPHYALLGDAIEGARVLQLGGGGYTAQYASLLGARVTCVLSTEAEVAQSRELYRGPSVSFVAGDPLQLPFPDASFDVVMAFEVAADVGDTDALCAELRRVLAPSGFALLTLPNFSRDDLREIMGEGDREAPQRSPAEVYASLIDRFEAVTLLSQTPFLGYFLTLHTGEAPRPFDLSYELLGNEPEAVLFHGFLVSDLELVVEEDRLVQVPFSHLVDRIQEGLRTLHRALERKNNALLEMREELVLLHGQRGEAPADARIAALAEALDAAEERGEAGDGALLTQLKAILGNDAPAPSGGGPRVSADEARLLFDGLQNLDLDEGWEPDAPPQAPLAEAPPAPSTPAPVEDDDRLVFVEDLAPFVLPGPVSLHSALRAELRRLRDALNERDTRLTSLGRWQEALRGELTEARDRVLTHVQTLAAWDPDDALTRGWAELGASLVQLCAAAGFTDEDESEQLLIQLPEAGASTEPDTSGERMQLQSALAEAEEAAREQAGRAQSLEMALEAARMDREAFEDELALLRERVEELEAERAAAAEAASDAAAEAERAAEAAVEAVAEAAAEAAETEQPAEPTPDPRIEVLALQVAEARTRAAEAEARAAEAEARAAEAEARAEAAAEPEPHADEALSDALITIDTLRALLRTEQDRARDLELALADATRRAAEASPATVDAEPAEPFAGLDDTPPLDSLAEASAEVEAPPSDDGLADQLSAAQARIEALDAEVETLRVELARQADALFAAEARADAAARAPSPADDVATTLLPAHPAHTALEARVRELEARLAEAVATAEAERDALQRAVDAREEEFERLQTQLDAREREVAQLHADLEHAWSQSIDRGSVSLTSEEPRDSLDGLEDPVAQMEARITDLHTQLDERDQLLDELRQDLDLKRSHVATLQAVVERQRRELKITREKVQAAISGIAAVQAGV